MELSSEVVHQVALTSKLLIKQTKLVYEVPLKRLAAYLHVLNASQTELVSLELDGLEQLTDAVLYMLTARDLTEDQSTTVSAPSLSQVHTISLVGCVHVTDYGMSMLAKACKAVKKVCLDGCQGLTEETIVHFVSSCTGLEHLSMVGTSVCMIPEAAKSLQLDVCGCPLIEMLDESSGETEPDLSTRNVLILCRREDDISLKDYLKKSEMTNKEAPPMISTMMLQDSWTSEWKLNITEFHSSVTLCCPYIGGNTTYIVMLDVDKALHPGGDMPVVTAHLDVVTRVNNIRGQAPESNILLVLLHDVEEKSVQETQKLLDELTNIFNEHKKLLKEQLATNDFFSAKKNKTPVHMDFHHQVNLGRSVQVNRILGDVGIIMLTKTGKAKVVKGFNVETDAATAAEEKKKLEQEFEKLYDEYSSQLSSHLDTLSKADISEIKSFSSAPQDVRVVLETLSVLLGYPPDKWKIALNAEAIYKMKNYDKDNMSPKAKKALSSCMEKLEETGDKLMMKSKAAYAFYLWFKDIDRYLQYKKQFDVIRQRMVELTSVLNASQKGDDLRPGHLALRQQLMGAVKSQQIPCLPKGLGALRKFLTSSADWKIIPVGELMQKWKESDTMKSKDTKVTSGLQLMAFEKALMKVHQLGDILFLKDVPGEPVVLDKDWFQDVLVDLYMLAEGDTAQRNLQKYMAFAPNIPLINSDITKMLMNQYQCQEQQIVMALDILKHLGLVIPAPTHGRERCEDLIMLGHLTDQLYIRTRPADGDKPTSRHMRKEWPTEGSASYCPDDVTVYYQYVFAAGVPATLVGQVLAQCTAMGDVISAYNWGVMARRGAVDVMIRNQIHGTKLYATLALEARTTQVGSENGKVPIQDHVWSVLNDYTLMIEAILKSYPFLTVQMQVPCRGKCLQTQFPSMFCTTQLPRATEAVLPCSACGSKVQFGQDEYRFMIGRHHFLPWHEFYESTDDTLPLNPLSPFNKTCLPDPSSHGLVPWWVCGHCGIGRKSVGKLWEAESSLYPSLVVHATKLKSDPSDGTALTPQEDKSIGRSCVVDGHLKFEKPCWKLLLWDQLLYISGMAEMHFLVLRPGPVKLVAGRGTSVEEEFRMDVQESRLWFSWELNTGIIQHKARVDNHDVTTATHPELVSEVGDRLSLVVQREEIVYSQSGESHIILKTSLQKNGLDVATYTIPCQVTVGLAFQCSSELSDAARIIVQTPQCPILSPSHYPISSCVLFKTRGSNNYEVGKVIETSDTQIHVCSLAGEPVKDWIGPESKRIMPACAINDTEVTIVAGKETIRLKEELHKYFAQHEAFPLPKGFFQQWNHKKILPFSCFTMLEAKWCCRSIFSPEVLEQANQEYMKSLMTNRGFKHFMAFLPTSLEVMHLFFPSRQLVHTWNQQELHRICKGLHWVYGDQYYRDMHFMNVDSADVSQKQSDLDIIRAMLTSKPALQHLLHIYYSLINHHGFLPNNWDQMLKNIPGPDNELQLSKKHVEHALVQYMQMYRSTFLMLLAQAQQMLYKEKPSSYSLEQSAFLEEPDQQNTVEETKQQGEEEDSPTHKPSVGVRQFTTWLQEKLPTIQSDTSKCEVHTQLSKKGEIKKLASGKIEGAQDYPECVGTVSISHIHLNKYLPTVIGRFPQLISLQLQACRLSSLDATTECTGLRYLLVPDNTIRTIPPSIVKLKDTLEYFDISSNPIKDLPEVVAELVHLRSLIMNDTLIRKLPENIGNLRGLLHLEMHKSLVTTLPDSFCYLKNLRVLTIQGIPWYTFRRNQPKVLNKKTIMDWKRPGTMGHAFTEITEEEKMQMFTECDPSNSGTLNSEGIEQLNQRLIQYFPRIGKDTSASDPLGGVPAQIFACRNLRSLSLSYQMIHQVPEQVKKLFKLSKLFINNNPQLESVSGQLGKCNIRMLSVTDCPLLRTPPKEIVAAGMSTIIAYLKRLSQGSVASYRTKLMIVGLGGAGKTSLMRALMSRDHKSEMKHAEAITDGIDINNWTLNRQGINLTYSVWDFAGQTVYYNTHQFFLSDRAVYLLVWNTRLGYEHSGLEFWLSSITCHCPKAPIFVVGTHADKVSKSELPMDQLQSRFPAIVGFHCISSLTGQGVADLLNNLLEVTFAQPYIGEMIPEAWLNFQRLILGKRNETSLLPFSTVQALAGSASIIDTEVTQAVQFLHDLGTLQHFTNELLRDQVVIHPQWIVDVMACVVTVHNNVIKDGRLKHSDLALLWKDYSADLHSWLLRLTEVFDLTFPLSDQEVNVVPCLLPQTKPKYKWPAPEDSPGHYQMKIIYNFEYLPAGLFNRAQVRLYQYSESSTMWKNGSLLTKNNHFALVEQNKDTQVTVKAFGPSPENILLMVHEVFEALITESFRGVRYEYQLPCIDCLKAAVREPTLFSSNILRRAIELKALFLQCHSQFHVLSISSLQSVMPPDSNADFDLQLNTTVQQLDSMYDNIQDDLFVLYHMNNLPQVSGVDQVDISRICGDIKRAHISCNFMPDLATRAVEDVMTSIKNTKVVILCLSKEFVEDDMCQRLFRLASETLNKRLVLLMVGPESEGTAWLQSGIGLSLTGQLFYNFQRPYQYNDRMSKLLADLKQILGKGKRPIGKGQPADVFISYAWVNSLSAIKQGHAKQREGALGHGDPRELKNFLHDRGITAWLDIEQIGQNGLFEDISVGIKQAKVMVACVSDEYVRSTNCQMEFRFAHTIVKLPIILAVVGTGLRWESTEVGMLSLGCPRVNFQVANNRSHDELLHHLQEVLADADMRCGDLSLPSTPSSVDTKQRAFQELYEIAQRKLLRQISGFVEDSDQYPRLFVADLNYTPDSDSLQEGYAEMDDVAIKLDEENNLKLKVDDLRAGQFCIRTLCEHEGGWHAHGASIPVELAGKNLVTLWERAAPYMARIMAILKHSNINLRIISTQEGAMLLRVLSKHVEVNQDIQAVYRVIRQYVIKKDSKRTRSGLARCYLPSGRSLWLCPKHQKLPRVSVLSVDDDVVDTDEEGEESSGTPEYQLLEQLCHITQPETSSPEENASPVPSRPSSPVIGSSEEQVQRTTSEGPSRLTKPGVNTNSMKEPVKSATPPARKTGDAEENRSSASQARDAEEQKRDAIRRTLSNNLKIPGRKGTPPDSKRQTSTACVLL